MNLDDINILLSKAAKTKSNEDYKIFFDSIKNSELFFNVNSNKDSSEKPDSIPLVEAAPGLSAVLFFLSKNNDGLKKPFGGLSLKHALEMVVNMDQADGLIIQGDDLAWIGINKEKARLILSEC